MGLGHYFNLLDKWAAQRGARWGKHYGPHDVDHRRQTTTAGQAETIKTMSAKQGFIFETVTRNPDKINSIMGVRAKLPSCCFDEVGAAQGIIHLENYSRDWDEKLGVWRSYPRHDAHSHGADGFMTFTDGYKTPPKPNGEWDKFKQQKVA